MRFASRPNYRVMQACANTSGPSASSHVLGKAQARRPPRQYRRQRYASHPLAACGCTKSSTMVSGSSPRKEGNRLKLYSRPGNDLTDRFPLVVEAIARLRSQSCIIDGEAVACGDDGISSFDRIRYRRHHATLVSLRLRPDRARWRGLAARPSRCARHGVDNVSIGTNPPTRPFLLSKPRKLTWFRCGNPPRQLVVFGFHEGSAYPPVSSCTSLMTA
jgi:hypothetical protein